ncbi:DUF7146 domain-containing protein [Roseateles chitinivorans]|uniref:DUF7146 domain-containing protein n=1 Tax=Roseateles chitinivorans TaxID=2917965 RepID=UPI003D66CA8C
MVPAARDPVRMPRSGESPDERFALARPLVGTPGQAYVERRGIPLAVAHAAGLRFDPDWAGRPAVLVALHDRGGALVSVHGRYLSTLRGQDKMLTIGPGGGVVDIGDGGHGGVSRDCGPLILVEGVFDALSLAVCGCGGVATIGRWAPWLPEVCADRLAWLGFDANRPGEREAAAYAQRLARVRRLPPPPRCKDWNTALCKRGRVEVARWLRDRLAAADTSAS